MRSRPNRKALTRREVLAFNPLWNDDDRAQVAATLDSPDRPYLYVHDVPSRTYLTGRDPRDKVVFWIGAGYIGHVGEKAGAPGTTNATRWISLSRHHRAGVRTTSAPSVRPVCDVCFLEVTPAGTCGCDE